LRVGWNRDTSGLRGKTAPTYKHGAKLCTKSLQFTIVELPLENSVIKEDGFRRLLRAFNQHVSGCLNPSHSLGLARRAFDEALNSFASGARFWAKADLRFPGIRWKPARPVQRKDIGPRVAAVSSPA